MSVNCPECEGTLRKREPNFIENVRRRDIDNVWDRYVCQSCEKTFSEDDVVEQKDENITMKNWMQKQ